MDAMLALPDAVRECQPVDDVTQVPWPDFHGCPYRPYGRFGYWLVFEEPHPKRGHARRQVFLTTKEARDGQLGKLEIDPHLLAAWFPAVGDDDYPWSFNAAKVEAWLHHHANIAEVARLNRYEARLRAAGRWPDAPAQACAAAGAATLPSAATERQPATIALTPPWSAMPDGRRIEPHARTLHVDPRRDGGATLAIRIRPSAGDDFALKVRLTPHQCAELARSLAAA